MKINIDKEIKTAKWIIEAYEESGFRQYGFENKFIGRLVNVKRTAGGFTGKLISLTLHRRAKKFLKKH